MKKINIIYWISTALLLILMVMGGVQDAIKNPEAVKMVHDGLHYPLYFLVFIGVAKILGAVAILTPGLPKLKEWAYAGFTFDLIGAAWSAKQVGTSLPQLLIFAIFLAILAVYYICHRKRLEAKGQLKTA